MDLVLMVGSCCSITARHFGSQPPLTRPTGVFCPTASAEKCGWTVALCIDQRSPLNSDCLNGFWAILSDQPSPSLCRCSSCSPAGRIQNDSLSRDLRPEERGKSRAMGFRINSVHYGLEKRSQLGVISDDRSSL